MLFGSDVTGTERLRRSISASNVREAKHGKYRAQNIEAVEAGNIYHQLLTEKLRSRSQEGDLGAVRQLGLFQKEMPVKGFLGDGYLINARMDNVTLSWNLYAMDVVEGKLGNKIDEMHLVQAALAVIAFSRDTYMGRLSGDCNFYLCYGEDFRLFRVNVIGMLATEEYLTTLAAATLAYLDSGGEGQKKSPEKNELKGKFNSTLRVFTSYAWEFINPVS